MGWYERSCVKEVYKRGIYGGGEIYRQKGLLFPKSSIEDCCHRLQNWYHKFDDLQVLTEEAKEYQRTHIRKIIQKEFDNKVENLQISLYIKLRMNNWGAGHFQNNASPAIAGLIDRNRPAHAIVRKLPRQDTFCCN